MNGKLAIDVHGESSARLQGRGRVELSDRTRWATGSAALSAGRADIEVVGDLGPAAAKIQGWIRPFDSTPTYDLQARVRQGRRSTPPSWLVRLLGDSARSVFLRLEGRGLKPESAAGLAQMRLEPGSADGLLDSASLRVRVRDGSASFRAGLGTTGGVIAMDGKAGWGSVLRLRVEHGSVRQFQLSALLGDSSWSALDGEFSLGVEARQGALRITSASEFNGAALELDASRSSGRQPTTTLKRLEFRHLDLSRFRSAGGPHTDLTGTAWLSLGGGKLKQATGSGRLDLENSRIGHQGLTRARLEARLEKGRVDASGEMMAETGTFEFTASSRPFDSLPTYIVHHAGFKNLDLGGLLQNEEISTQVTGSLSAEGSGHGPDDARLTATLLLDSSSVNRSFIREGRLKASVIEGRLDVLGQVKGDGDSLSVDASVSQLRDHPRIRLTSRAGIGDLAALLGPRYPPDVAGAVGLTLAGELDRPERMNLRGELQVTGRAGEFALDSSRVRLGLADGIATVDSFALHSNVGSAGGAGKMHLFGETPAQVMQLRLSARLGDLAPVAPLLGVPDLTLDSAQMDATVSGTRDTLQVDAALHAAGLATGDRRIGKLEASGSVELTAFKLSAGTAELLAQAIHTGKSPVQSVQLKGSALSAGEFRLRGETMIDAGRDARFAVRIHPGKPETRLRLDTLEATNRNGHWALAHPVDIRYGERFQLDDFVLASGRRRIAVDGTIDPKGQQKLSVRLDSLGIGAFTDLTGSGELDGVVNGMLDLTGPAAAPHAVADLSISLRARNKDVVSARSHLEWTNEGAEITGLLQHPKKNDSLSVRGRIPIALSLVPVIHSAGCAGLSMALSCWMSPAGGSTSRRSRR